MLVVDVLGLALLAGASAALFMAPIVALIALVLYVADRAN